MEKEQRVGALVYVHGVHNGKREKKWVELVNSSSGEGYSLHERKNKASSTILHRYPLYGDDLSGLVWGVRISGTKTIRQHNRFRVGRWRVECIQWTYLTVLYPSGTLVLEVHTKDTQAVSALERLSVAMARRLNLYKWYKINIQESTNIQTSMGQLHVNENYLVLSSGAWMYSWGSPPAVLGRWQWQDVKEVKPYKKIGATVGITLKFYSLTEKSPSVSFLLVYKSPSVQEVMEILKKHIGDAKACNPTWSTTNVKPPNPTTSMPTHEIPGRTNFRLPPPPPGRYTQEPRSPAPVPRDRIIVNRDSVWLEMRNPQRCPPPPPSPPDDTDTEGVPRRKNSDRIRLDRENAVHTHRDTWRGSDGDNFPDMDFQNPRLPAVSYSAEPFQEDNADQTRTPRTIEREETNKRVTYVNMSYLSQILKSGGSAGPELGSVDDLVTGDAKFCYDNLVRNVSNTSLTDDLPPKDALNATFEPPPVPHRHTPHRKTHRRSNSGPIYAAHRPNYGRSISSTSVPETPVYASVIKTKEDQYIKKLCRLSQNPDLDMSDISLPASDISSTDLVSLVPQPHSKGNDSQNEIYHPLFDIVSHLLTFKKDTIPNRLQLSAKARRAVCWRLHKTTDHDINADWIALASAIGVDDNTVDLIQRCHYSRMVEFTCGEVLLMFWEYFEGNDIPGTSMCLKPCNLHCLCDLLQSIGRYDVAALLQPKLHSSTAQTL